MIVRHAFIILNVIEIVRIEPGSKILLFISDSAIATKVQEIEIIIAVIWPISEKMYILKNKIAKTNVYAAPRMV